jgi:uncharacterized protein
LRAWYTPAGFEALATREAVLEGEFAVAAMQRLAEHLGTESGTVTAQFAFSRSDSAWIRLEMTLQSNLSVTCQRCLEPLELNVSERVEFGVVLEADAVAALPGNVEPVVLDGDRFSPQRLVEDEMIVVVPMVPKHASGRCVVHADSLPEGVFADSGETKTD